MVAVLAAWFKVDWHHAVLVHGVILAKEREKRRVDLPLKVLEADVLALYGLVERKVAYKAVLARPVKAVERV